MRLSRWRGDLPWVDGDRALCPWLREPASLTARLQRHGRFRIHLLRQHLHRANVDECDALGLASGTRCWVREVVLFCDDIPVIFAHTVLPARPCGVLTRWFARLGGRSLGSLLFAHPGFVRGQLAFARLDRRHPLYEPAISSLGQRPPEGFLARRCTHRFRRQAVLVTEVFSPLLGTPDVAA